MKQIPLSELCMCDFAVTELTALYQTPVWTNIDNRDLSRTPRISNGFLLVDKGSCRYDWEEGSADLSHGGLLYLPAICRRAVTVTEREFSFYRLKFMLRELGSGEELVFSDQPLFITDAAGQHLFDLCADMVKSTVSRRSHFRSMALLYEFLCAVNTLGQRNGESRIAPALAYIETHCTQELSVEELAEMCYLSQAQLFRLFRAETGTTPIQYRNRLRIDRAREMLEDPELGVGEIASNLGFENLYYFSRLFRSMAGVSPTEYRRGISSESRFL